MSERAPKYSQYESHAHQRKQQSCRVFSRRRGFYGFMFRRIHKKLIKIKRHPKIWLSERYGGNELNISLELLRNSKRKTIAPYIPIPV